MSERNPDPEKKYDPAALSAPERAERVRTEVRFHALKLCHLLLARSREAWFREPVRAVELAELAVEIAARLDTGHYGEGLVEDAKALAWAHLGNAYRIASDLRRAEEALLKAEPAGDFPGGSSFTPGGGHTRPLGNPAGPKRRHEDPGSFRCLPLFARTGRREGRQRVREGRTERRPGGIRPREGKSHRGFVRNGRREGGHG